MDLWEVYFITEKMDKGNHYECFGYVYNRNNSKLSEMGCFSISKGVKRAW